VAAALPKFGRQFVRQNLDRDRALRLQFQRTATREYAQSHHRWDSPTCQTISPGGRAIEL